MKTGCVDPFNIVLNSRCRLAKESRTGGGAAVFALKGPLQEQYVGDARELEIQEQYHKDTCQNCACIGSQAYSLEMIDLPLSV